MSNQKRESIEKRITNDVSSMKYGYTPPKGEKQPPPPPKKP